jgi:hypothetical protein
MIQLGEQAVTELWWREDRPRCKLFVSQLVLREAARGDKDASDRRLRLLDDIVRLEATVDVHRLVRILLRAHALPASAEADAIHVALAAVHEMDILLTWNCKHIANPMTMPTILATIEEAGHKPPTITTPQDFLRSLGELS